MLKELFDALKTEILKGAGPLLKEVDPSHDYVVFNALTGKHEFFGGEAEDRGHSAFDLETVVKFAETDNPAIWYSRNHVICFPDDSQRRDEVKLKLSFSEPYKQLVTLENQKPNISQRNLIFMLRTKFAGCLGQAGNLVDIIRQIKFEQHEKGESTIKKGSSSVGKSVRSELTCQGDLPETVIIDVPIFEAYVRAQAAITCIIEPDESTATFQLFPLPGQLEMAAASGENAIKQSLIGLVGERGFPIYYGNP